MATKITFVTGKGGVGKSTVAAALALMSASEERSLLAEIGDSSFYQTLFHRELQKPMTYEPQNLLPGLDVCLWRGEDALKEYARYLLKVETLYRLFFENQVMNTLIRVAPGLSELSIMGKITSGARKYGPPLPYEKILVDSFATGHFLALLRAPKALANTVQLGPMGDQGRQIDQTLKNPQICDYVVVTIPEDSPVQEAIELHSELHKELGFAPKLILNRCLVSAEEMQYLESLGNEWAQYRDFLQSHWEREQRALQELKNYLQKANLQTESLITLPFYFGEQSLEMVQALAKCLRESRAV